MQSHKTEIKDLTIRIAKLERQNRSFKRILILVLTITIPVLLMGFKSDQNRTVEAERFLLLDSLGKVRTELSVDAEGKPHLIVFDKEDRQRLRLGGSPTGPRIEIIDYLGRVVWVAPDTLANRNN